MVARPYVRNIGACASRDELAGCMSFCEVVDSARLEGVGWLPFHGILLMVDPVSDPVESQVHCLGLFWLMVRFAILISIRLSPISSVAG